MQDQEFNQLGLQSALPMLSIREAAGKAYVSIRTLHRWIRAGKLAVFRLGRTVRIDSGELDRHLKSLSLGNTGDK